MRILRDFDIGGGAYPPDASTRLAADRTRAFVEAMYWELRAHRLKAPFMKLAVSLDEHPTPRSVFAGPSVCIVYIHEDPRSLATTPDPRGTAGQMTLRALDFVRAETGWSSPDFEDIVRRVGTRTGPYVVRTGPPSAIEKITGRRFQTVYEFDETTFVVRVAMTARGDRGQVEERTLASLSAREGRSFSLGARQLHVVDGWLVYTYTGGSEVARFPIG